MAGITFTYGPMFAGKTHELTKLKSQFEKNNHVVKVLRANPSPRAQDAVKSPCKIESRTGANVDGQDIYSDDVLWIPNHDSSECILAPLIDTIVHSQKVVIVDEAQFLTVHQIDQLVELNATHFISIYCYGLRADIFNKPFPGSAYLMACSSTLNALQSVCACGSLATCTSHPNQTIRSLANNDTDTVTFVNTNSQRYFPVCYKCWASNVYSPTAH